jgi:hypothetical protein
LAPIFSPPESTSVTSGHQAIYLRKCTSRAAQQFEGHHLLLIACPTVYHY